MLGLIVDPAIEPTGGHAKVNRSEANESKPQSGSAGLSARMKTVELLLANRNRHELHRPGQLHVNVKGTTVGIGPFN
jgi:hypothetical protein